MGGLGRTCVWTAPSCLTGYDTIRRFDPLTSVYPCADGPMVLLEYFGTDAVALEALSDAE